MSNPTHETGHVRSGDVQLFYRKFGRPGKTPILIAHGLSYFSYDWIEPAQALATNREVIALDTRGFGDSGWSRSKDYSVPTLAKDIANVLDSLAWKQVILVGHSMSGRATSLCAADNPARVAGLALVDYTPENAQAGGKRVTDMVAGQPDHWKNVDECLRYFGLDPASAFGIAKRARYEAYLKPVPDGVQLKRDLFFRDQFKRAQAGDRPKLGLDMWEVLGRVRCPMLSIRGKRSDMYDEATVPKMFAVNSRMQVMQVDAGHDIAGENLPGFLAAMNSMITALER